MSTPATFSSRREENIHLFVESRRENCDKLLGWKSQLLRTPGIRRELSNSLEDIMLCDWDEFTLLHDAIREDWSEADDADHNGWDNCWWTEGLGIQAVMEALIWDLHDRPAYYHYAELAEILNILSVCIGQLQYQKEIDDHVRQMRDAAQQMNRRRRYFGPRLGALCDELFEIMQCECQYCGADES
ncbi:uncharacterized protein N7473_005894 [Penicillium subrubescens]|uniref:Uncharacterized protein n=1 Tax=Penicillium subrubescens TaxID=1316194 RepID=A0A1Q5UGV6_9EURO|nr:uncharacterized protein N7473_005894 [Penicillium subrubescens]KAJ5896495.1 hypothetical protein N7473_005894 [Penicillium subrubescens]OKP11715.1 hypothetical protein PENSUB_2787 [Penicillium subrubescens]